MKNNTEMVDELRNNALKTECRKHWNIIDRELDIGASHFKNVYWGEDEGETHALFESAVVDTFKLLFRKSFVRGDVLITVNKMRYVLAKTGVFRYDTKLDGGQLIAFIKSVNLKTMKKYLTEENLKLFTRLKTFLTNHKIKSNPAIGHYFEANCKLNTKKYISSLKFEERLRYLKVSAEDDEGLDCVIGTDEDEYHFHDIDLDFSRDDFLEISVFHELLPQIRKLIDEMKTADVSDSEASCGGVAELKKEFAEYWTIEELGK